jgi:hypothetical protein
VENGIDIAHTSFVHPGFGYREMADKNHIVKMERGEYSGSSSCVLYPPPMPGNAGLMRFARKDKAETHVHPGFYLSGHCLRLHTRVNSWMEMIIFDANTPVDEHTTRSFVVQVRNFFKWGMFDKGSVKRTLKVFREDAAIVEALSPHYFLQTLEAEVSVEQDKFKSAWRKVLRTHIEEKGWNMDGNQDGNRRNDRHYRGKQSSVEREKTCSLFSRSPISGRPANPTTHMPKNTTEYQVVAIICPWRRARMSRSAMNLETRCGWPKDDTPTISEPAITPAAVKPMLLPVGRK